MRSLQLVALVLAATLPATAFADRWHHHDRGHDGRTQLSGSSAGAIAYSPSTGKVGYSYGYPDWASAEAAAVNACGVGDCAWLVAENDEYAVLAIGSGGAAVAWNTDLATAETDALAACSAKGENCVVERWVFK